MKKIVLIGFCLLCLAFQLEAQNKPITGLADPSKRYEMYEKYGDPRLRNFNQCYDDGLSCYNSQDWPGCIYYYKMSKKTDYHSGGFMYLAGMSYYFLENNKKAKSTLKKAAKHGSYDAQKALVKLFKK